MDLTTTPQHTARAWWTSLPLRWRLVAETAVVVVVVTAVFLGLILSTERLRSASDLRAHSGDVIATTNRAEKLLLDLETGERGFVITGLGRFLAPWRSALSALPEATAQLTALVRDNPSQEAAARAIQNAGAAYIRGWSRPLIAVEKRDPAAARRLVAAGGGKREVDALRAQFSALIARERALDVKRTADASSSATRATAFAIGGLAGSLLFIALFAVVFLRSIARPLTQLGEATGRIAAGDLSGRLDPRGPREFSELLESFNAMASSLEQSRAKLIEAESELAERLAAEQRAHGEADAARERISQLLALTEAALAHSGLESLLDELLGRVRQFLRVDTAAILLATDDGRSLVARGAKGLEEEVEHRFTLPFGEGFAGKIAAEQRAVVIDDVEHVDLASPVLRDSGVRSLLGVPLLVDGRTIGVLHVGTLTRREFGEADVQLVELVADRAALAIERTRLSEAEQAALATAEAAKVEADRANLAKSEFLSRMSHELRTPLNAVIGFGQLLELEELDERQRDNVDHIVKAGRHLLELINEVLEISRIESGQLALSPEPVPLAETVREVLALAAPLAASHDVELNMDASGLEEESHVRADRQRLRQVLLNLFANAIKYNRPGGRVEVSFETVDAVRIRTVVADTGIGIGPEELPRVFEPFDRLGAEASQVEGTGLGLALSKRLVEAMGGVITVQSELGQGSTFVVELEITDAPDADESAAITPPPSGLELGSASGRHLLLYIEDNLSNLKLVERILERQRSVELISAMQGRLGLDLASQHRPSVIILDLHLPDMPGEQLLRRLKADPATRDIPVVVLSADASPRQSKRLLALGAVEYLTKPLDVQRFVEVIAANLAFKQEV